ncbi:hypothetical protein FRC02_000896, partial [Tulasnella sp. 418]
MNAGKGTSAPLHSKLFIAVLRATSLSHLILVLLSVVPPGSCAILAKNPLFGMLSSNKTYYLQSETLDKRIIEEASDKKWTKVK